MAITRGQMQRQLRRGGGIMDVASRELLVVVIIGILWVVEQVLEYLKNLCKKNNT